MAETNQYFYDSQIRRFIIQFIRIFSGWQVKFDDDNFRTVPVMYGDPSRQAAAILKQNSENTMNTVPAMAAYVTGLDYDRPRIQQPDFVDKRDVRMRRFDPDSGQLTTEQGNAFSIERHMPVPYRLTMKLDIWTSNTTQKLELFEQIATLFNPSFEIQSTDNYFDWTSLTTVDLEGTNWDSRSVPVGGSDAISIMTFTFRIPIWVSPAAKVKKLGIIRRIVTSVYDLDNDDSVDQTSGFDDNLLMGQRVRITPSNYDLVLLNGELTLHRGDEFADPDNDNLDPPITYGEKPLISWDEVFNQYTGPETIEEGISQIALLLPDEINEITGTITRDETNANKLFFDIDLDTIPANDLTAIDAVIDPKRSGPGTGLDAAAVGQRYLLVDNIGFAGDDESAEAWRGTGGEELVADKDDVVEYDGTQWNVVFDASESVGEVHYLTNLTTEIQYAWASTRWVKSYDGEYLAGTWQVIF